MNKHFKPTPQVVCPYCGTTHGLRIESIHPMTGEVDAICAACFTGQDDGPCFDDLEPVKTELRAIDCTTAADWARWTAERVAYEDPCGYQRSRY